MPGYTSTRDLLKVRSGSDTGKNGDNTVDKSVVYLCKGGYSNSCL